ncbi:hypothetical protein Dip510_001355 [Elusimicrobium posterum]|uniref:hypothetical protein n=1 Tax=Elusimicrobium posterum TaxID=3116653 RepID=UPI003C736468
MCKKIISGVMALGLLLLQFPSELYAQKAIQAVTYYPTPYGAYMNVDADTVVVKDTLEVNTLADVEKINVTGTLTGNINRLEAGNAVVKGSSAAAPTIKATQRVHVANESSVAGITADQANVANTFYLDGLAFPYAKAIDPSVSSMSWKQITYYTDKTNKKTATRTFLVLEDNNSCTEKNENDRVWENDSTNLCQSGMVNCKDNINFTGTCTAVYTPMNESRTTYTVTGTLTDADDTCDGNKETKFTYGLRTGYAACYDVWRDKGTLIKDYVVAYPSSAMPKRAKEMTCCDCTDDFYGEVSTASATNVASADTCDGSQTKQFTCGDNDNYPLSCLDEFNHSCTKTYAGESYGSYSGTANGYLPSGLPSSHGDNTTSGTTKKYIYYGYAQTGDKFGSAETRAWLQANVINIASSNPDKACAVFCNGTGYGSAGSYYGTTIKDSDGLLICGNSSTPIIELYYVNNKIVNSSGSSPTTTYNYNVLKCQSNIDVTEKCTKKTRQVQCCQKKAGTQTCENGMNDSGQCCAAGEHESEGYCCPIGTYNMDQGICCAENEVLDYSTRKCVPALKAQSIQLNAVEECGGAMAVGGIDSVQTDCGSSRGINTYYETGGTSYYEKVECNLPGGELKFTSKSYSADLPICTSDFCSKAGAEEGDVCVVSKPTTSKCYAGSYQDGSCGWGGDDPNFYQFSYCMWQNHVVNAMKCVR